MDDCGSGLDTDIDDLSVVDAPTVLSLVATAKHLAAKERRFPLDESLVDWRPCPSWTIPNAPANSVSHGDIEANLTAGRSFDPRFSLR